jgi:hypothetical protein
MAGSGPWIPPQRKPDGRFPHLRIGRLRNKKPTAGKPGIGAQFRLSIFS